MVSLLPLCQNVAETTTNRLHAAAVVVADLVAHGDPSWSNEAIIHHRVRNSLVYL